jgi:hypothetical protein
MGVDNATSRGATAGDDGADSPHRAPPPPLLSPPAPTIEEAGRALRNGRTERLEKLFVHLSRFGAASLNSSEAKPSGMKDSR